MESQQRSTAIFSELLAVLDPEWDQRSEEERREWVGWYARTARAIARQFALSFRDPCHDAADVMQEIRLKLLTKFLPLDAPHRLLTERPCMRNLMSWKGLDLVDWENAARRSARRRSALPEEDTGLASLNSLSPEQKAELDDEERAFRREIRDPFDRQAYLLFRAGKTPREVAKLVGRSISEVNELRAGLSDRLSVWLTRDVTPVG